MDTALELFLKNGYDKTSIQQIIEEVDIAKGTFYHYFQSKEDLLDSIARKTVEKGVKVIKESIAKFEDPLEKLNELFRSAANWKKQNIDQIIFFFKAMYTPENLRLRITTEERSASISKELIEKILINGLKDGTFKSRHNPDLLAETIITTLHGFNKQLGDEMLSSSVHSNELAELMQRRLELQEDIICQMLGLKPGTINIMDREILNFFIEKLSDS